MSQIEQIIEETLADVQGVGDSLLSRARGEDRQQVEDLLRILGTRFAAVTLGDAADQQAAHRDIQHAEQAMRVIALRYQIEAFEQAQEFLARLSARVARFAVTAALGA